LVCLSAFFWFRTDGRVRPSVIEFPSDCAMVTFNEFQRANFFCHCLSKSDKISIPSDVITPRFFCVCLSVLVLSVSFFWFRTDGRPSVHAMNFHQIVPSVTFNYIDRICVFCVVCP
jgi:hypothetical protein